MAFDEQTDGAERVVTMRAGPHVVRLGKVYTPNGNLLEITDTTAEMRVRLDAVELEALSWQDRAVFRSFIRDGAGHGVAAVDALVEAASEATDDGHVFSDEATPEATIVVTNEYAEARVHVHETPDGDRCVLVAPKLGYRIVLTPAELAGLTWQDHDTLSRFLETPYGPQSA